MALTYYPEDTSELSLKRQQNITCPDCKTRRTIDEYDEPTIATCIGTDCTKFFLIPAYEPTTTIEYFDTEEEAMNRYNELKS